MTSLRPRTRRLVALTGGMVAVGLALAACSATNPITTEDEYDASDGVSFTLGDIRGTNLLLLTAAEGEPGVLEGGLVNDGDDEQSVTLTFGDQDPTTVQVDAHTTVLLDGTDEDGHADVRVDASPAAPGAVTPLTIEASAGSLTLRIPVLDGTLPEYATAVPTAGS